jgi:hypothetical protein
MRLAASQHTRGGLDPVIVVDPDRAFNVLPHWPIHTALAVRHWMRLPVRLMEIRLHIRVVHDDGNLSPTSSPPMASRSLCQRSLYRQPGHLGSLTYAHFPGCQVSVNTTNILAAWANPGHINENDPKRRPGCHWPGYFVGHLGSLGFRNRGLPEPTLAVTAPQWEQTSDPSGR